MPSSPRDAGRAAGRLPGAPVLRAAVLALGGSVLALLLAVAPAQAAGPPSPLVASQPTGAPSSSAPSPSPGQRPSATPTAATPTASTPTGAAAGVSARDDTGTGLVLPLLAATVIGLVVLGLLFAGAVNRRQREERRL